MDPLTQALIARAQGQAPQAQPQPQTPVTPPNPPTRVPTKVERFNHAQQIQDAYRGGWTPNPVLLQASLTK